MDACSARPAMGHLWNANFREMIMNERKILLILLLSLFGISTANASGSCEKLEYAELKDTPKEELISRYCRYGKFTGIASDTSRKMYAIGASREGEQYSNDAIECLDEMGKIARILKNQHQTQPPAECLNAAK